MSKLSKKSLNDLRQTLLDLLLYQSPLDGVDSRSSSYLWKGMLNNAPLGSLTQSSCIYWLCFIAMDVAVVVDDDAVVVVVDAVDDGVANVVVI